jgi:hypothetical protein
MSELRTIQTNSSENMQNMITDDSVKQEQTISIAFENIKGSCAILNGPCQISPQIPQIPPQIPLTTNVCCNKCKKTKSKDVPPEWIEEMKDLRKRFGLSYSKLAMSFGLTRFVAYNAITNDDKKKNANVNVEIKN